VTILGACQRQLFTNSRVLIANNVSGWRCKYQGAVISTIYYWYNMDLNRECAAENGAGAYAGYLNFNDPGSWRSWRCWRCWR
jgi:hypothetical protein